MQYTGQELISVTSVLATLHNAHIKLTLGQVEQVLKDAIADEELRDRCWSKLRAVLLDALNRNNRNVMKLFNIRHEK